MSAAIKACHGLMKTLRQQRVAMIAATCPFCGSSEIHAEKLEGTVVISCLDCLAVGPMTAEQSQAEAWERWNRRASQADGSGLSLVDPPDDPADSSDSPAISEPPQPTACFAFSTLVPKTHYQKGPQ